MKKVLLTLCVAFGMSATAQTYMPLAFEGDTVYAVVENDPSSNMGFKLVLHEEISEEFFAAVSSKYDLEYAKKPKQRKPVNHLKRAGILKNASIAVGGTTAGTYYALISASPHNLVTARIIGVIGSSLSLALEIESNRQLILAGNKL